MIPILAAVNNSSVTGELVQKFSSVQLGFLTDNLYFGNTLFQYLLFIAIIGISFAVGKITYYLLKHKLRSMASKTQTRLDDILIRVMQGPLVLAVMIVGLMYGIQVLTMPIELSIFLANVLSILVSLAILWFVIRLADVVIDEYMRPMTAKTESKFDDQLIPFVKKAVKLLVLLFGIVSIISNFGYDITALITGLGIGGIAIAFAAQETISNMFGGVTIHADRPFTIGDRVKVGDVIGDVIEVGTWSSKIKNLEENIVVVPNSMLSKSIIINYTRPTKSVRREFTIGVTYDTVPDKMGRAIEIIRQAVKAANGVTKDEPEIYFSSFGDFSLNITCRYWVKSFDYALDMNAKHEMNMKILKEFNKEGISFAFPTQTIHLAK